MEISGGYKLESKIFGERRQGTEKLEKNNVRWTLKSSRIVTEAAVLE